jgi:hypothetical protein
MALATNFDQIMTKEYVLSKLPCSSEDKENVALDG